MKDKQCSINRTAWTSKLILKHKKEITNKNINHIKNIKNINHKQKLDVQQTIAINSSKKKNQDVQTITIINEHNMN